MCMRVQMEEFEAGEARRMRDYEKAAAVQKELKAAQAEAAAPTAAEAPTPASSGVLDGLEEAVAEYGE